MTRRELRMLNDARTRHGRRKTGLFVCEGRRCCQEALQHRPDWAELIVCSATFAASAQFVAFRETCQPTGLDLEIVKDHDFALLAMTQTPQGVLCLMRRHDTGSPHPAPVPTDPLVLILDRVREPGNLGTILRTAWAVGLTDVWLTQGSTDPFGPKCIRAGMGAQFALGLHHFPDLQGARSALTVAGWQRVWCAVPRHGVSCFSDAFQPHRSGIVIGNETQGVAAGDAGTGVTIPMPGQAESLNAAQAATVLLFEAVRRGLLNRPASPEQRG